jgi:hypothetical protein
MGQVTETQVVAAELEKTVSKVPVLFDWDDVFYSTIEKGTGVEKISNRDMRIPLELKPGGKFGYYNPDGGDLGRGSGPQLDKAVISTVHFKMGVEWTKLTEMSTDSPAKAVLNYFRHILAKSMAEFRRNVDSACMTAGNGVLGVGTTLTAGGGTGGGDKWVVAATDGFGVRLLREGADVGIFDTTLATKRAEVEINYYDLAGREIHTLPAVAGAVSGDKFVTSGLSANPVGLLGVPYHHSSASTGTWLGMPRATVPQIRANRVNAAGAFALPFARLAVNKIGDRVGSKEMGGLTAWTHHCQKDAYEQVGQLVSVIQKQASQEKLNMYFDGFQLAGAPLECSYSWDKTRIDFINKSLWGRAEMHPAGYYTSDGQKIFPIRGASGGIAAAFIFYLIASFNLYLSNPAMGSYIDGLTIPSGY